MAQAKFFRLGIAAVAVAAHVATLGFAAMPQALAAPCPVHGGMMQVIGHANHGETGQQHHHVHVSEGQDASVSDGVTGDSANDTATHPLMFGAACCAWHTVGVTAGPVIVPAGIGAALSPDALEAALTPVRLSGSDPPPRPLL